MVSCEPRGTINDATPQSRTIVTRRNAVNTQRLEGRKAEGLPIPEAFRAWNAQRAIQGARLREVLAAIMQQNPTINAREVRQRLIEQEALPRREPNGHLAPH